MPHFFRVIEFAQSSTCYLSLIVGDVLYDGLSNLAGGCLKVSEGSALRSVQVVWQAWPKK